MRFSECTAEDSGLVECDPATCDSEQSVAGHKQPVGPPAAVKGLLSSSPLACPSGRDNSSCAKT
jgi:hypothetical protein